MHSTSSSDYEEYCKCGDAYGNQGSYGRTPFYPTMGQPLIYYAQVPPPSKKLRNRESRKDNNCFAKAFRWYTKEHVPYRSISPNKTELSGFAAWLDTKYDEFIQDSQLDGVYQLKMKQTSTIEANMASKNTCCKPRHKRFRVKSPWRKRCTSSKEAGDVIQKPNQSFQFILQPQDLTRPASASDQLSNNTVMSNEIPTKTTIKSQSYTLVAQELAETKTADGYKSENNAVILNKDADHGNKSLNKTARDIPCQCSLAKVVKTDAQSQYERADVERVADSDNQITPRKIRCQHYPKVSPSSEIPIASVLNMKESHAPAVQYAMSFQGPKELIPKAHSQSQHQTLSFPHKIQCSCFHNEIIPNVPVLKTKQSHLKAPTVPHEPSCQCPIKMIPKADSRSQHQAHDMERGTSLSNTQSSFKLDQACPCERDEKLNAEILAHSLSPIAFSHGGIQTSDHSIRLEKDAEHRYPLFMKIICADKLCK